MGKKRFEPVVIVMLMMMAISCGGRSESDQAKGDAEDMAPSASSSDAPKSVEEAMKEMEKAIGGVTEDVEPVDFRELRALLPEELAGMKRVDASGQKTGAMGVKVSNAEAKYKEDGSEGRLDVSIADLGTLKGLGVMSYAAWLNMTFDRETSTGYERTTKYQGFPAMEKFERNGTPRGEISVAVGQRFVVTVKGSNVEMGTVKAAIGQIDLETLKDLK